MTNEVFTGGVGMKSKKDKGKVKKTDDLESILASVEALATKVLRLEGELDAFKIDPNRRGPPGPRGTKGNMGLLGVREGSSAGAQSYPLKAPSPRR